MNGTPPVTAIVCDYRMRRVCICRVSGLHSFHTARFLRAEPFRPAACQILLDRAWTSLGEIDGGYAPYCAG